MTQHFQEKTIFTEATSYPVDSRVERLDQGYLTLGPASKRIVPYEKYSLDLLISNMIDSLIFLI